MHLSCGKSEGPWSFIVGMGGWGWRLLGSGGKSCYIAHLKMLFINRSR